VSFRQAEAAFEKAKAYVEQQKLTHTCRDLHDKDKRVGWSVHVLPPLKGQQRFIRRHGALLAQLGFVLLKDGREVEIPGVALAEAAT
jgi:hypothetical protein